MRGRRERDDHDVDVVPADDFLQIPARPEDREAGPAVLPERLLVEEADRPEAEFRAGEQPRGDEMADPP
jgi:hypothetical protein